MQTVTNDNFGPLIAYLVPGATVLVGVSNFSPPIQNWFSTASANAPSIGGFLYLTFASIAAGMTVSAVRWAVIDSLHANTGLPQPQLNFSRLAENVTAFGLLIEIHYRHYQFYANMFVALATAYICYRLKLASLLPVGWPDLAFVLLEVVFFSTSRDTLRKYYLRSQQLLSTPEKAGDMPVVASERGVDAKNTTCGNAGPFPAGRQTRPASHPTSDRPSAAE